MFKLVILVYVYNYLLVRTARMHLFLSTKIYISVNKYAHANPKAHSETAKQFVACTDYYKFLEFFLNSLRIMRSSALKRKYCLRKFEQIKVRFT